VPRFPEDKLQVAYLDSKYQQFWLHLVKKNIDLNMVKKVIRECYNQLQNGEEVYKFGIQQSPLFDTILNYMQNFTTEPEDEYKPFYDETRVLASMCFKQFCRVLDVKEKLHVCRYIEDIHNSFEDEVEDVRINVYLGLLYFSQSRYGIDALLSNGILQQIIKKITEEKSMIVLNLILMLINEILNARTAPQIALQNEILLNLKLYINSTDLNVLENTILVYGSLSLCEEGKRKCVEEGTLIINFINKINSFLNDETIPQETAVKIIIGCVRFLMSVSILKRGKVEIYENKGIDTLFSVLQSEKFGKDEQVILDILQCVTNVAEEPRARKMLRDDKYMNVIKSFEGHEDELIKTQEGLCVDVIMWEP
jgi:hypothetical protein